MKTQATLSFQKSAGPWIIRYRSAPRLVLGVLCLVGLAPAARAQLVDIGVRSRVIDKDIQWSHKTDTPDQGGHSKTFAILAVDEVKSEERLVKPVDEEALLRQLYLQLEKNGFQKYVKGTKPDILLRLEYGRGNPLNPFLEHTNMPGNYGSLTGMSGYQQLMDQRQLGFEANLQKAGFEKLFVMVTAWEFPKDPKVKPKRLWKTMIVADDPDHRDVNLIAAQMLAAGAPYFDKDIKDDKREINIYQPVPDGHVNVGTPEVVKTDVKK